MGTHPILSKICFPFLLSALLPPLLLPACSSRSAPVILSSLPSCPLSLHKKTQPFAPAPGSTFLRGLSPAQSGRAKCWVRALVFFLTSIYFIFADKGECMTETICALSTLSVSPCPMATSGRKQLLFPSSQRCLCPHASRLNHPLFTATGEENQSLARAPSGKILIVASTGIAVRRGMDALTPLPCAGLPVLSPTTAWDAVLGRSAGLSHATGSSSIPAGHAATGLSCGCGVRGLEGGADRADSYFPSPAEKFSQRLGRPLIK